MDSKTARTKLCWSCEGRVSLELENCPYCGVYLSPTPLNPSKGDPIVPLYSGDKEKRFKEKKAPEPPYQPKEKETRTSKEPEIKADASPVSGKEVLIPLMTLLSGAVFLLFGLVLLLFSDDHGYFTLKWNGGYWPFYLGLSVLLLFVGWRSLNQLPDE